MGIKLAIISDGYIIKTRLEILRMKKVMSAEEFETYDFLINDEDEVMLLLYVRPGEPVDPSFNLDIENQSGMLCRNDTDKILLKDIPADIIDSLQEADKLLVCELSVEQDDKDTRIVYAYEAEITD